MKLTKRAKREAKELFRQCLVNDSLDEDRVREVVGRVVAIGPRECPAILAHFMRLVKLELARRSATIASATPLPPDLQAFIEASLTRRYGPGLRTTFVQRPELIGGMRIQVGCDVVDGTVRAGLAALEKSF